MPNTSVTYVYGGAGNLSISFPYLDPTHIKVYVGGVLKTLHTPTQSGDYSVVTSTNEISFITPPSVGASVFIKRDTQSIPLVDWTNQTAISGSGLDITVKQPLYALEEHTDHWEAQTLDITDNTSAIHTFWPMMQGGLLVDNYGLSRECFSDYDLTYVPSTINPGAVQGNLACPTMTASNFNSPSDERLKKNIEPSDLGLSFIKDLRPVKFQFKQSEDLSESEDASIKNSIVTLDGRERNGSEYKYGLIAQELKTAVDSHSLGADVGWGRGVDEVETISSMKLIAPLIKAVQELSQTIEELENRLATIESA